METVVAINSAVNGFVWGPIMCVVFMLVGLYLSIRTKFFQFSRIGLWWRTTIASVFTDKTVRRTSDGKSISQFQALTTALAATIGTGNIVGVATAIVSGGPGAVFWMWIAAILGMMTKFSEIALSINYRVKNSKGEWLGGPMLFLDKGLHQKWLAVLFALFTMLASFGIGNGTQANSVAGSLNSTFGIPPIATGIVLAVIVALVIIGGIKRIGSVTEKLVPFMAIFYIIGGLILIIMNASNLGTAFRQIFEGAFRLKAVGGGVFGYTIARAMRYGVARGVFSNEAGLGSSSLAHSSTDATEPIRQAMWGCFEVFADTIIVCSITALSILTSGVLEYSTEKGAALTIQAFSSHFGAGAGIFVSVGIVLFAFSTICGWSYYGERSFEYLFGTKFIIIYRIIFVLFIIIGCIGSVDIMWDIADSLNGLMAIPNLIGLIFLAGKVSSLTKDYIKKVKK